MLAVSASAMTSGAGGGWPPRRTMLLAGLASALIGGWVVAVTAVGYSHTEGRILALGQGTVAGSPLRA